MKNLGIDLGRTVVGPKSEGSKAFENSFEVINKLTKLFNNTFIISRVNSEQRERAINWLEEKDFYNLTGIKKENVYFCFDRKDKCIFVQGLNIDWFIDDRPDVLIPMKNEINKILFNPWEGDLEKHLDQINEMKNLTIVKNWKQIAEIFKV
jgi:hypothetical protein